MADVTASPAGRLSFLTIKALNLALLVAYSFGLIFVLVRSVPAGSYPWMVMLSSIGTYVLAVDLGFSNYAYSVVRRRFLEQQLAGAEDLVAEAVSLYLLIAAVACAIAAPVIWVLAPAPLRLAMLGYFATIVIPLPWMLIRRVAAAVDLHVQIEVLECIRRALFCGILATMLVGMPLIGFVGLALAGWAVAMAAAWLLLRAHGFRIVAGRPGRMLAFLAENGEGVVQSGSFTALEFIIYNFPYLLIPVMFHGPANLVGFDLFNKVTRFGGAAYSVPAEAFSPQQTRAYYAGDHAAVDRFQKMMWAVGAVPMVVGGALVILVGGPLFEHLLAGLHAVPIGLREEMAAMLAALLLQTSAGGFLLSVGRYGELTRAALVTVGLMLAAVVVTMLWRLSFSEFMLLYVLVYGVHAAMFQAAFRRLTGRARHEREALA
jgi:hypothetical protein